MADSINFHSFPYSCPICNKKQHVYLFAIRGLPVFRCPGCGLVSILPKPDQVDQRSYYMDIGDQDPAVFWTDSVTELEAAQQYLELIEDSVGKKDLLIIAPPDHLLARLASERGWKVTGPFSEKNIQKTCLSQDTFDAVIILFQLEKSSHPDRLLGQVYQALKLTGFLLLVTPSLDSTSARYFGSQWTEWRPENLVYFNNTTIQLLLWRCSFQALELRKDRRYYTLEHINDRAAAFPKTVLTRLIHRFYRLVPRSLTQLRLQLPSSGIIVTALKGEKRQRPLCSVVLPAFNERDTYPIVMEALLEKQIPGMDKEIIVIESNSEDGTREEVMKYSSAPGVKVILQEKARGKGNAVREGFKQARGDVILIQDADLEYDLNDYDALLEPLANYEVPFVLGIRHGGSLKMRQFDDQEGIASVMNFGHVFFTTLMNFLYRQRMKDPFTMYKVFQRDCIHGLEFECNRFDFDHELVIKLLKKGYTPLEIPVNYRSRSFKQGKKVNFFRDPVTWVWINLKLRFTPVLSTRRGDVKTRKKANADN